MYYANKQVGETFVEIEYEGHDYALCCGTLVVRLNGVSYEGGLTSGGRVWFDDNWSDHVETGPWTVRMNDDFPKEFTETVTELVNSVVPWGCCGGCV